MGEWFPELADQSARQKTWPLIEPHHAQIDAWLGKVTIATIHQRLRDVHSWWRPWRADP